MGERPGAALIAALLLLITCAASAAAAATAKNDDQRRLNVHVVCHSHDDSGWLKNVDQYFYGANSSIQVLLGRGALLGMRAATPRRAATPLVLLPTPLLGWHPLPLLPSPLLCTRRWRASSMCWTPSCKRWQPTRLANLCMPKW